VLVWWIVCLWIDEPGTSPVVEAPGSTPEETPQAG
jgi:hypothetical protein